MLNRQTKTEITQQIIKSNHEKQIEVFFYDGNESLNIFNPDAQSLKDLIKQNQNKI